MRGGVLAAMKGMALRIVLAILTGVMVAGLAGGYLWMQDAQRGQDAGVSQTQGATDQIEREIRIRAATGGVELNGRGWPTTVDVSWWDGRPPQNPLVPGDRPWLEVASEAEADLDHPPVRQSVRRTQAAFWYNPARGVVRARVGPAVSDRVAIEVYNRVNGSSVSELFDTLWEAGNSDLGVVEGETGGDVLVEDETHDDDEESQRMPGVRVTRGDDERDS